MNAARNPVGWFEIYVQDMERARKFYETTFQVELTPLPSPDLEMWAFPQDPMRPGCGGALAKMPGKDAGGGGTLVYFSCADCAEESRRAVDAGGQMHFDKRAIGEYGFIALLFDTEGNMIGLHSLT